MDSITCGPLSKSLVSILIWSPTPLWKIPFSIPTIGIGASKYCDGQILVTDDIIGLSDFRPRFVKKYSDIKKVIEKSVKNYCSDVKKKKFPSNLNVYKF